MTNIYLLRHSKTEQDFFKEDFDRELIEKWFSRIKKLIKKLKKENIVFDEIISSPAKRSKQTAEEIYKKTWTKKTKIIYDDNLYHSDFDYILSIINNLKKQWKWNFLIVWHNPDIEDVVNYFANDEIWHLKTCWIFKVS